MDIYYSTLFKRQFKKLPHQVQKKAVQKEKIFRNNQFHASLRTHKLTGRLKELWSFSIDYEHRIIFYFLDTDTVIFEMVGDHSVYQK